MFTKSKRPSVDHCALTLAPSCSTSELTSRMRCGLFFTVWTPSGVRVVSMMYVGMAWFLPRRGAGRAPPTPRGPAVRLDPGGQRGLELGGGLEDAEHQIPVPRVDPDGVAVAEVALQDPEREA